MPHGTTLEARLETWLSIATRSLAPDSAAQVRVEISEHYQSALASGTTSEGAIASLGDPRRANREYRRVLLTAFEAIWAPLAAPVPGNPTPRRLHWSWYAFYGAFIVWALVSHAPFWNLWIWGAVIVVCIARDCFLPRESVNRYFTRAVQILVQVWFYCQMYTQVGLGPLFVALAGSAALFLFERRIRRKLAGLPNLVPDSAREGAVGSALTCGESRFLRMLERESKRSAWTTCLMLLLSAAYFFGGVFLLIPATLKGAETAGGRYAGVMLATSGAALFFHALTLRGSFLQTPERGHRFRRAKWTMMAIVVLAPPVASWMLGRPFGASGDVLTAVTGVYYILNFLVFSPDLIRVQLRRKLPESQWPKELYL